MTKIPFPYFTQNSVKQFTRTQESTSYCLKKGGLARAAFRTL